MSGFLLPEDFPEYDYVHYDVDGLLDFTRFSLEQTILAGVRSFARDLSINVSGMVGINTCVIEVRRWRLSRVIIGAERLLLQ